MSSKTSLHDFNLLRSLEVFLAIVEQGQLTRAAEILGITQSAVSQHLNHLESLYATVLVDRSQRPMRLTLTGHALQEHASEILRKVEAVNLDLDRVENERIPMLRIGLLPSLATLLTPVLIEQARSRYRVANISLYADLANVHQHLIQTRQVDLLVTSQPFYDLDGLVRYPLLEENFCLILPPGDVAFDGDLERLAARLPMVRFSASTPAGLHIDQHLRRCRVEIPRCLDADRTTMIMAAVAAGQGFSILSPTLLLDGIIEGMQLRILPLPLKPLARSIILVNREGELGDLPRHLGTAIQTRIQSALELLDPVARDATRFGIEA